MFFFANESDAIEMRVTPLEPLNRTSKVLQKSSKVFLIMWIIDRDNSQKVKKKTDFFVKFSCFLQLSENLIIKK